MKRILLLLIVAMFALFLLRIAHRHAHHSSDARWRKERGWMSAREGDAQRRVLAKAHRDSRRALDEARAEVRQAFREAGQEVREAFDEARDEMRREFGEARAELVSDDDSPIAPPQPPSPPSPLSPPPPPEREDAEGLPVQIVPGTRVTHAEARPPAAKVLTVPAVAAVPAARSHAADSAPASTQIRKVPGRVSANEERAEADARHALDQAVASWLDPDVPADWMPPAHLVQAMVRDIRFQRVEKDYGTLFVAEIEYDASPARRSALVAQYNHEVVQRRLLTLGGGLAFVLACLAVVSGYIRADEVTRGYYTNRLRLLAAAGLGAAGVVIYRMVA